ncbi:MAG: hypothetical protein AAGF12_04000 [Myxococcota bacterium]
MGAEANISLAEQDALARQAAEGSDAARDALIDAHRDWIRGFAKQRIDDDRLTPAVEYVIDALRRAYADPEVGFDYRRGYRFGSWCPYFVRRALDEFRGDRSE